MNYEVKVNFKSIYLDSESEVFNVSNEDELSDKIEQYKYDYISDNIESITYDLVDDVETDYISPFEEE